MSTRIIATVFLVGFFALAGLRTASASAAEAQSASAACPSQPGTPAASPAAAPAGTPAAAVSERRIEFDGGEALLWVAGEPGVVLAHGAAYDAASWRPQAEEIAAAGATVLALESIAPEAILAGISYLRDDCGLDEIALIGASAGGGAAISAVASEPDAINQLILLSASGDVASLGEAPKLFVATEGEGMAESVRQMAEDAPGAENEALILSGDAHAQAIFQTDQGEALLQAILERLSSGNAAG